MLFNQFFISAIMFVFSGVYPSQRAVEGLFVSSSSKEVKADYMVLPDEFKKHQKWSFMKQLYTAKDLSRSLTFKSSTTKKWVVYADRSGVSAKREANPYSASKAYKTSFMQPFFVKNISGSFLELVRTDNRELVGWISVDNLILSPYACLNEESLLMKGFVLFKFPEGKKISIRKELENYNFYYEPAIGEVYTKARKFIPHFIYKETSQFFLLGSTTFISGNRIDEVKVNLRGWLNRLQFVRWEHSVALEPTNVGSAASLNDSLIRVFQKIENLRQYHRSMAQNEYYTQNTFQTYTLNEGRIPQGKMRLPLIESIPSEIDLFPDTKKVAVLGYFKKEGIIGRSEDDIEDLILELRRVKNKRKSINILFVMDGTYSMKEYYPELSRAMSDFIRQTKQLKSAVASGGNKDAVNYRYGLATYRDYEDGAKMFNLDQILDKDGQKTIQALKNVFIPPPGGRDKTLAEALYDGVLSSVLNAGFSKDETNIVILIGDAGNHRIDQVKMEGMMRGIRAEFSEKDINLIAYQVHRPSSSRESEDFQIFCRDILRSRYQDFSLELKKDLMPGLNASYENDQSWVTNEIHYEKGGGHYLLPFGSYVYPQRVNTSIAPEDFVKLVSSDLEKYFRTTQVLVDKLEFLIKNKTLPDSSKVLRSFTETTYRIICENYIETSDVEGCMESLKNMGEFAVEGYTSTQAIDKQHTDQLVTVFNEVLYVNAADVDRLIEVLDALSHVKSGAGAEDAQRNFETILAFVLKEPEGLFRSEERDLTFGEVWEGIFGEGTKMYPLAPELAREKVSNLANNPLWESYSRRLGSFLYTLKSTKSAQVEETDQYWIPLKAFSNANKN